ncbi:MAG TPA: hypothetical protein VHY30_02385, partial [Verrucomicrobiae bacterium]|nr:hypothetical protein [Verrucomicrobiae bacterium]
MKPNYLLLAIFVVVMQCALDASGQAIIQIVSDNGVSFFVKSDGSLWRGDFAHAMAKHKERMKLIMNEAKQHPQSTLEKLREEGKSINSDNFEPVDLIVSNGVTAVAMNIQGDTFFIKDDGSLWAMGNNQGGYLGDGTFDTPDHPIQIVSSGVKAVVCGEAFTIFLKDDGSVWGFGWSGDGELGIENNSVMKPKKIITGEVVSIAAGYLHSLFIKSDGSLWGMGNNGYGQLGLGTNINHILQPAEIVASNVVSIAASHNHSLFI